jgi:hypothetical protein
MREDINCFHPGRSVKGIWAKTNSRDFEQGNAAFEECLSFGGDVPGCEQYARVYEHTGGFD